MRVLLLTQYYPPEIGAAQNRLSHLARSLASSGHIVTVVTALPNYPTGKIFEGYQGRVLVEEPENGGRVIRTWIYTTKSKAFLKRMVNYCSFSGLSLIAAALKVGRQDVVIVESPPLFLGFSGFLISRLKGARFALNVSDLWPQSAVVLGVLRNGLLIRVATRLEEFLYRKAHLITGQTEGIVANIESRCTGKSVALIPNGVDTEAFLPSSRDNGVRERMRAAWGFNGRFVIGYTGLFGLAQGLETVVHSAQLAREFPDILFAFIGDGPEKSKLVRMAEQGGLQNVRFFPVQPASRMPAVLAALDVALVPIKRHPLFNGALPSKMFEAMGAGVPVIGSVSGEARALIQKSQGGICVEPERPEQMAEAILQLYRNPVLRQSFGENGWQYVRKYYNRAETAKKFEQLLLAACTRFRPALLSETGV